MSAAHNDPALMACARRVLATMAVYMALILTLPFFIFWLKPSGPALWLMALLPAVPLSMVFWFYGRCFAELRDEYVRMLEIRKVLIATGLALTFATAWGFLESYANAPHVPMWAVAVAWFPCHGIGSFVSAMIERRAGQ